MRKLLEKQGSVRDALVTDKLRCYVAAEMEVGLSACQERGWRMNDRGREFAPAGGATRVWISPSANPMFRTCRRMEDYG
jgi:hypothetical protein